MNALFCTFDYGSLPSIQLVQEITKLDLGEIFEDAVSSALALMCPDCHSHGVALRDLSDGHPAYVEAALTLLIWTATEEAHHARHVPLATFGRSSGGFFATAPGIFRHVKDAVTGGFIRGYLGLQSCRLAGVPSAGDGRYECRIVIPLRPEGSHSSAAAIVQTLIDAFRQSHDPVRIFPAIYGADSVVIAYVGEIDRNKVSDLFPDAEIHPGIPYHTEIMHAGAESWKTWLTAHVSPTSPATYISGQEIGVRIVESNAHAIVHALVNEMYMPFEWGAVVQTVEVYQKHLPVLLLSPVSTLSKDVVAAMLPLSLRCNSIVVSPEGEL